MWWLIALACAPLFGADVTWLVRYDGERLPSGAWKAAGSPAASIEAGALRLRDEGNDFGFYRANWKARPGYEIVVEARVKVGSTTGSVKGKTAASLWPWRDGAPVSILVSDGRHQEGLALFASQAATFTDRFIPMDTTREFHDYRLEIRETDMSIHVDGVRRVVGQGAFWKKADSPEPFIQFGSNAKAATGDAIWEYVRLGVRKRRGPAQREPVEITISEPWEIPRPEVRQTRPYLYDMGGGMLLMSVAQGPDAFYEPYGLLKSADAGRTWTPVPGLDQKDFTPLPVIRLPDMSILAMSRWTWLYPDGSVGGKTFDLDPAASSFTMHDNRIELPPAYRNESKRDQTIAERHLFHEPDGSITMAVWSRKQTALPDGRTTTVRHSHLVRSSDKGRTWRHVSMIGPGGEPAVARTSARDMTAVIRGASTSRMTQTFSRDGGQSWDPPIELEEGRVAPDLVMMSNGVLACSYGRPASCLMFSVDSGKTWSAHRVISERTGFNYSSIREIAPGRLLYVHDAPRLRAVYVDVKRR